MSARLPLRFALPAVLLLCAHTAGAQAQDPVAAEQLFVAGRAAMDAGDLATACDRFAESQRLDPAAGTLINLAECLERRGLFASSWQRWKEAFDGLRSDDDRKQKVAERMKSIDARVPKLELKLAPGSPASAVIARDGHALGAVSLGLPLPIDPGAHQIRVTAEGREPRDYPITIVEGQTVTLEVAAGDAPAEAPAPVARVAAEPPRDSASSTRTAGWVAVGVGALGLTTGAVFGLLALTKKGTVRDHCSEQASVLWCDQEGLDAARTGHTFATIANVGVGIGLVGAAVGATLLLTTGPEGKSSTVAAEALPGGGAVKFARTF